MRQTDRQTDLGTTLALPLLSGVTSDKLTSLSLGVLICKTSIVLSALVLFYSAQILKAHGGDIQHSASKS